MKKLSILFLLGVFVGALHVPMTINAKLFKNTRRRIDQLRNPGLYERLLCPGAEDCSEWKLALDSSAFLRSAGVPAFATLCSVFALSSLLRGKSAPVSTTLAALNWAAVVLDYGMRH